MYSNTLDICLFWILSRGPIWIVSRDPILVVPSIYFVRASCSCFTSQIPWRSCCCPLVRRFWQALLITSSLFISVILKISWKDCLVTARNVPGILVPGFYYFSLVTKKVSWDFFLALLQDYSTSCTSSFSARRID